MPSQSQNHEAPPKSEAFETIPPESVAETRTVHPVFPGDTNHYHTLSGGTAMEWMDQAAFISATRWCREKVVTVHTGEIDFRHPVKEGTIVQLVARVIETGNTSLTVQVEMYTEPMYRRKRALACTGNFVLVALDQEDRPTAVPSLESEMIDGRGSMEDQSRRE